MARDTTASLKTNAPMKPLPVTKDDLRAQVEKLEKANALLRGKGRQASRAAKVANARIAELEANVEELKGQIASQAPAAKRAAKKRSVDPGDAVPPGVAVQDPEPMDTEAEKVFENLECRGRKKKK